MTVALILLPFRGLNYVNAEFQHTVAAGGLWQLGFGAAYSVPVFLSPCILLPYIQLPWTDNDEGEGAHGICRRITYIQT